MKFRNFCIFFIVLSAVIFLKQGLVFPGESSSSKASYIAKFGNTGITLEDFNQRIEQMKSAKGSFITGEHKRDLLNQLVEQELVFHDAKSQGMDRDPGVVRQIDAAVKQIVASFYLGKYFNEIVPSLTEEDVEKLYRENIARYSKPDMYNATVYYVNRKNIAGKDVPEESTRIAEDLKQYLDSRGVKSDSEEVLSVFSEKYPDVLTTKYELRGYWKGKNTVVAKPVLDALLQLEPGQTGIMEQDTHYAVFIFNEKMPGEPMPFELVKSKVIAEYEAGLKSEGYRKLIERLSEKYQLTIDESLLNE